jgi:hypothetical protein
MTKIKAIFLLWAFWCIEGAAAQQVNYLEYYINVDPGHGLATSVPITPGETVDNVSVSYPVNSLADGLHRIYFRARDNQGRWSMLAHNPFLKVTPVTPPIIPIPNIDKLEYFIDTDPGYGLATSVAITPGEVLENVSIVLQMNNLTDGLHKLYVRARDSEGLWSLVSNHTFLKITPVVPPTVPMPQIVKAEYFINNDPGYGNGVTIPVPSGSEELQAAVNLTSLALGTHSVYVRIQDNTGKWSMVHRQNIVIANNSLLVDNVRLSFCRNTAFNLPYQAYGSFAQGNVFTAQLSDINGNFDYPTVIGSRTATSSGNISATIPPDFPVGKGYKLRVISSMPNLTEDVDVANFEVTESCPAPCSTSIVLVSPANNVTSGQSTIEAKSLTGKISAQNKVTGSAKITFKAGVVELNPGFIADAGTVFRAEVGGCE